MRLGIISDCVHFYTPGGTVGTENHIYVRQMEALAACFSQTVICCPFTDFGQNKVFSNYTKSNISFIALPNVGGNTIKEKLKLLTAFPRWFSTFKKIDKNSDIVYQRFPNNLNIPGFFYFYLKRKKVFGTYTGTWSSYENEPPTYKFQRWLLSKFFRGPVWVYVDQKQLNKRIFGGFSPSYNEAEWQEEAEQVERRIEKLNAGGLHKIKMITVGTLIDYKNQMCILQACVLLKKAGIDFTLTIVGDGPMRLALSDFIRLNNLENEIEIAGKKNHVELRELYRQHDFVVQAPLSEGFGKVPVEGFFHGVIPVINDLAMAKFMTGDGERGFLFDANNPQSLADVLQSLPGKSEQLPEMIQNGRAFAKSQTLEAWADNYFTTIQNYFGKP